MCKPLPALFLLTAATLLLIGHTSGQNKPDLLTCSPAPCVLPPIQASEGGAIVNDAPIVVNPLNHKQILVGSNDFNCPYYSSNLGFHLSQDGGSTWNLKCLDLIYVDFDPYVPIGPDPSVGYDTNGVAYIAGVYFDTKGDNTGFVGFEKSADGVNWSPPAVALYELIKDGISSATDDWLTIDTSLQSLHRDNVYVSAVVAGRNLSQWYNDVVVSHSTDSGAHWKAVRVVPPQPSPAEDSYTSMSAGKDGTVYLTWMYCNYGDGGCIDDKGYMLFSKSSDGGNTWTTPVVMTVVTLNHENLPNANVGVDNYPAIAVDNSDGPHAGNLYVSMYSWTGTQLRVGVVRSTDGGKTWSKPVPVAPPSETHDQFFPWISVSSTGLVGVSWLDRRNDPANIDYQAFAGISRDGGRSFGQNVQLTTAFSNPNLSGENGIGDRTGNTWAGSNFLAAWMDSSNGVDMQVMVGGIRVH
ncbi:MAG: glycoside hydrolase [Acidobacteriia bacterium]|nr:glycoside hydrolase [Terriglobia bacterium]